MAMVLRCPRPPRSRCATLGRLPSSLNIQALVLLILIGTNGNEAFVFGNNNPSIPARLVRPSNNAPKLCSRQQLPVTLNEDGWGCRSFSCLPTTNIRRPQSTLHMMSPRRQDGEEPLEQKQSAPSASLLLVLVVLAGSILVHWEGWTHFAASVWEMKSHSTWSEFSSAMLFWGFAAMSHPLMEAAFGISEILHASPGPKILEGGLIPISFLVGSGVLAVALVRFQSLQRIAGTLVLAAFLNYVGTGLEGTSPSLLADYNIQLDDDYQGRVVKGCPDPEAVQLSTVANFDYQRYQGRWYWHKVHDWTQFHQMYDTALDIRLTDTGYVNTLTIKGPSESNSPLSWDKSPLMNGARYSWNGIVDHAKAKRRPGVSQESGFGVTFPNYIVDVQTGNNAEEDIGAREEKEDDDPIKS